ncbi:MAG: SPASM domain-containing protein [Halanaerobiales bacterium]|nr:SPASM domain-containing protein [Halanaerobiales bacterium]
MNLKPSYYNHLAKLNNGKVVLFNFLTGNLKEIDEADIDKLKFIFENCNKNFDGYSENLKKELINDLYLVPEDANELDIVRIRNLSTRYDNLIYNLVLMPTLDCNFSCKYCYESKEQIFMSEDVKIGIINWATKIARVSKRFVINWFGGEPLLDFSIIEEINSSIKNICTENRCFFISDITTNGYLLTDEILSKVDNLNITSFQITVDGPPEIHNKYRPLENGEGTFDIVYKNILKILDQTRANVALRVNVDQNNFDKIPDFLNMIPKKYRTPRLMIVFKDIFSDPSGKTGRESEIDQNRINTYKKMKQLYHYGMEQGFNVFLPTFSIRDHHCNSGSKNYFIVHPTGDLYRCTVEFATGKSIGKLFKDGSLDIDSYATSKWLSYIPGDDEKCAKCKFLPLCQGGCRYNRMMGKLPCSLESTDIDGVIELYYLSKTHSQR